MIDTRLRASRRGMRLYNPGFKVVEFDHFRMQAGLPAFVLSAKQWTERTGAIGIFVQSGRYGGTYAHRDIAFEFGSAISPVFKLYLLKEYQRLKDIENDRHKLEWDAKRFLSKQEFGSYPSERSLRRCLGLAGIRVRSQSSTSAGSAHRHLTGLPRRRNISPCPKCAGSAGGAVPFP